MLHSRSNLYLVQKQEDGKLAFICKETGKSFSDSSDFLTYCESEVVRSEEGESMANEEPFARSKIYYQYVRIGGIFLVSL